MNQLITSDIRMTSLDVSEIVGKKHQHIMRDIRNEIESLGVEVGQSIFGQSSYYNSQNKKQPCYEFGKDGAMQLALKYDAKTRYRVIKKIEELENEQTEINKPSYMIDDPIKRAEKWITEQRETQELKQENETLKPKAAYHDLILQSKSLLAIGKIAKDYGMGAQTLNKILHELGVQYKQGGTWMLYYKYQDKGYAQTKTHTIDSEKSNVHLYWTQKGRMFIYEILKEKKGIIPLIEKENEQLRLVH